MARLGIAFVILLTIVSHVTAICEKKIISGKFSLISKESLAAVDALRKVAIATPHHRIQLATIATDFTVSLNHAASSLGNFAALCEKKIISRKFSLISKESLAAVDALRKVAIATPHHRIQLATIATDFTVSLNHAASSLGNFVVNFAETKEYHVLVDQIQVLSKTSYEIQQALSDDSEHLKEKLVALVETLSQAALKNKDQFDDVTNNFEITLIKKHLDFVIYGVYKLKYQAVYFEKTNKELIPEMKATLTQFTEKLNSLPSNFTGTEAKLRDVLLLTSILTSRNAYKIENWVEVNIKTDSDLKTAEKVVEDLANLYLMEINAITQDRNELKIRTNFINVYTIGLKLGTDLTNLEYSDNTGGSELIRSCIFDVVTLGRAIVGNFEYVLPTL